MLSFRAISLVAAVLLPIPGFCVPISADGSVESHENENPCKDLTKDKRPNSHGLFSNQERAFYRAISALEKITLAILKKDSLISRVDLAGEVYEVSFSRTAPSGNERRAASMLSRALKLPIVLIPDLPGYGSIPAIDGILFSKDGTPVTNLSFKSAHSESYPLKATRNAYSQSNSAMQHLYNLEFFDSKFRPPVEAPDDVKAIPAAVRKLFGIDQHGLRPYSLVIDYLGKSSAPVLQTNEYHREMMRLNYGNGSEYDLSLSAVNDKISQSPLLMNYWFVFSTETISVSRDGITKISVPQGLQ